MIMLILGSMVCIIVYVCIGFIVYVLIHILAFLGQLLVQLAALLSCHYCNSVPAVFCAWRWQINDDDDDDRLNVSINQS